jgi:hypothetical protein
LGYIHPDVLPETEQYLLEITLGGGQPNKSISKPVTEQKNVSFNDVKTLAVNDLVKDRSLVIRLMTKVGGLEIAKT